MLTTYTYLWKTDPEAGDWRGGPMVTTVNTFTISFRLKLKLSLAILAITYLRKNVGVQVVFIFLSTQWHV